MGRVSSQGGIHGWSMVRPLAALFVIHFYQCELYVCTNQGCGLFEKSHSLLQFPSVLLCIPVGLELDLSEAILGGAHIQVPKYFQMRNDLLDLS